MPASVTARDVAQHAEVSVGTVSRVFNNHSNVSPEIRQRVLKVAADLGYFRATSQIAPPRPNGRGLTDIGFLYCSSIEKTPATMDPYWAPIFHGVESASHLSNAKIIYRTISDIREQPHILSATLYEMRLGGVILVGQGEVDTICTIQETGTPLVQVDNYLADLPRPIDTILPDNFQGARLALDYLFSEGHKRIAFIGGPSVSSGVRPIYKIYSVHQRWVSYCTAMLDHGMPLDYNLVESGNLTLEGGYEACKRLLARQIDFSAIFCVDDITAIGAMKALREAGRKIPEDVSIIGFDGIDLGQHVTPTLSTIRVDSAAMGAIALKTVLERAAHPDAPCVTTLIGVELVKRESVAPPRNMY